MKLYNTLYLSIILYVFHQSVRQQDTEIISPMRLKADLLLFMVAIIWGTAFVAQGIAGQYQIAYLFNGVSLCWRA